MVEIRRDVYLNQLIHSKHNGFIKVVSGLRRVGKSYLLRTLFKNHLLESGIDTNHIIEMSFDLYENADYRKASTFFEWISNQIQDTDMYYILLDEVQLLEEFVSILNSLADKNNCDVYVSGSNAKFLSKDIVTEFSGRSEEIHMFPLSFSEFMSIYEGHYYDGWNTYLAYGGIPLVVLENDESRKMAILSNLYEETYLRDIVRRNHVKNREELQDLSNVIASSIGSLTNPHKLQKTFKSVKQSSITSSTISKYISYFIDSFLIEEAKRFDIKGKAYIDTPLKYYFSDLGIRNAMIHFRQDEPTYITENIIYNELRMRGFIVDVGNVNIVEYNKNKEPMKKQLEVDFIASSGFKKYYIQSAYVIDSKEKLQQEIRPFMKIRDSFKKIVITSNTPKPYYNEDGILFLNIYDFLLNKNSLDI